MDTEKMLPYDDFNIDNITLYDYTDEGLNCITSFVEITRYIEEIHQLFDIFQYNIRWSETPPNRVVSQGARVRRDFRSNF